MLFSIILKSFYKKGDNLLQPNNSLILPLNPTLHQYPSSPLPEKVSIFIKRSQCFLHAILFTHNLTTYLPISKKDILLTKSYMTQLTIDMIERLIFALVVTLMAYFCDIKYQFFFLLSLPQVLRQDFQKALGTMKMRSFRIFVGPASICLQLLMFSKQNLLPKLCLIIYGLFNTPKKDNHYLDRKFKHGMAMKLLFHLTLIEWTICSLQIFKMPKNDSS